MRSIGLKPSRPTDPRSGEGHPAPATNMKKAVPILGAAFSFVEHEAGFLNLRGRFLRSQTEADSPEHYRTGTCVKQWYYRKC